MAESLHKAHLTAITSPVLDLLDDLYSTPCEGTGIFPMQATLNHSCEPNVSLLKDAEDEEDGRVVATLSRDVACGAPPIVSTWSALDCMLHGDLFLETFKNRS